MSKLDTISWKKPDGATESFDMQKFVKETLTKLGKQYDGNGKPLSHGFSNVQHCAMIAKGVHEIQSLFGDANEPTKEERQARLRVIEVIGVNTSQSRQTFEKADLLVKSEGEGRVKLNALDLVED